MNNKYSENQIAKIIVNEIIQTHKFLGPGLLENVYKLVLHSKLLENGLFVEKEKQIPLAVNGKFFECAYRADLLVENKVIVEVKSVEALSDIHKVQTLTYLKIGGFKLGILVNFNELYVKYGIRRIINNNNQELT